MSNLHVSYSYGTLLDRSMKASGSIPGHDRLKFCEVVLEDDDGTEIQRGEYVCTPDLFEKPKARKLAFTNLISKLDHSLRFDAWVAFAEKRRRY